MKSIVLSLMLLAYTNVYAQTNPLPSVNPHIQEYKMEVTLYQVKKLI